VNVNDALAYLIVFVVIGLMFWSIFRENKYRKNRSVEEYERDMAETRNSLLRAGMMELDRFVGGVSGKRAAVEYLKDEEQGQTKTSSKDDDADRTRTEE
jgi:hypothetical protein